MDTSFDPVLQAMDPLFIWAFRLPLALTGSSMAAFLLGTAWVCMLCIIIGEFSHFTAYWLNRKHYARLKRDMIENSNLSLKALAAKDKASYKACNSVANEAFGRSMFLGIALFAASIWPAAFALAWMARRFGQVEFQLPLLDKTVGFAFFFLPMYITLRILFSLFKNRIPPFKRFQEMIRANEDFGEKLMTMSDLLPKEQDKTGQTGKAGDTPA